VLQFFIVLTGHEILGAWRIRARLTAA